MSASTEKKVRQAQREAGTDKKTQAALEEAKKKSQSKLRWTLAGIGIALLVILVLVLNSTALYTKTTALTIGDKSYSPSEVTYAYANQYQSFVSQYGSYASLFGLDTSNGISGLANQTCTMMENGTWKDYFMQQAIETLKQTDALETYAKENGIELDEDEIAEVNDSYASLEETAVSYGYKNADALIAANYGRGNNVATATAESLRASLASKVYNQKSDEIEAAITDEEVKEEYPTVAVRHILIKAVADENGEYTDEAKAEAQAKAEALLAQWAGTATDEQKALIAELAVNTVEETEETEEAAETEETAEAEEPAETEESAEAEPAAEEPAEEPTAEEMLEEAAEEIVEEAEVIAEEVEAAVEEIVDLTPYGTEEYFAELADTYSEDTGSNTNGGLYDSVMEGQMVDEFDAWCFDEARQSGDTGIVYGESSSYAGYHVMYFVGEGDPANNTTGRSYIASEKLSAWMEGLTENMEVSYKFFNRLAGKLG